LAAAETMAGCYRSSYDDEVPDEPETYAYTLPIRVCLRDLDGLGHVNNAVYLTYLETARNRYVFERTGKRDVRDFDFILARTEIDFRFPAEMDQTVAVELRPCRIGSRSWDLEYRIREMESDRLLVEARSVQVAFNYDTGRSMAVPEEWRRLLSEDMRLCGLDPA